MMPPTPSWKGDEPTSPDAPKQLTPEEEGALYQTIHPPASFCSASASCDLSDVCAADLATAEAADERPIEHDDAIGEEIPVEEELAVQQAIMQIFMREVTLRVGAC